MRQWDKVSAEMWVEVTPQEIQFTTLFDEIVFTKDNRITYRAHTPDRGGPLHDLYEELSHRFRDLHVEPIETSA